MQLLTKPGRNLCVALGLTLVALAACESSSNNPPVNGPPPLVDGTTVSPSPTLRQGQDGVSLVFTRAAGGLAVATGFDLAGLVVARQPESTDARLVLAVSVPHGAALGARALTFSDARGAVSVANVVTVGAISSAPAGVDTNLGTSAAPFRTLKHALEVAGAGDTIQLADGTYDAAAGETWGYTSPAGLTLAGQSTTGTTLVAPPPPDASTPGANGLVAPAGLTLKTLTLSGFDTAVATTGTGTLSLTDVAVSGALTAAVSADATDAMVTISGGSLASAQDTILFGDGCASCELDVTGTSLDGSGMGGHTVDVSASATGSHIVLQKVDVRGDVSVIADAASLSVGGSTIKEIGTESRGTINFSGDALDVTDTSITLNADNFGVNFGGHTLTLTGVTIEGGKYGVYQLAGDVKLRGTKIRDYGFMGYYLAQGDLDLGTATEAGDNLFSSSATGDLVFGLYVDGIIHPVTSSNTTFNGVEPPAKAWQAAMDQMIDVPGEYFLNFGAAITFYTL
jgi:hypothetical protein